MDIELLDSEFDNLRELVYELTGITLADGKRHMLKSRLAKRVRSLGLGSFGEYYKFISGRQAPSEEVTAFINAVTTNKTDFYREPHHFDFVTKNVVPGLLKQGQRKLRVWHAGCSSGEEPYTLAIELLEKFNTNVLDIKQLATDIDTNVLTQARTGVFELEKLSKVPLEIKRKYFLRGKGSQSHFAKARPELSEWMTFSKLNLLDETWPFKAQTKFDVIFCRNVMIYFDKPTQRRLIAHFLEYLAPTGFLLIGHSESLLGLHDGLRCLGNTVYCRSSNEEKAA